MNIPTRPHVTQRRVLVHFLRTEANRPQYKEALADICDLACLTDPEFYQYVRQFAGCRGDVNPVLTYTIGTGTNQHHQTVVSWESAQVPVKELYSCGINPIMANDLADVGGNLVQFAAKHANKYTEFKELEVEPSTVRIIAVERQSPKKIGKYQILDGAHRIVALARSGIRDVEAFVAQVK